MQYKSNFPLVFGKLEHTVSLKSMDLSLILQVVFSLGYLYTKQKHLGCKKGKANQKQQLPDYSYIAIFATKNFDIS